MSSKAGPDLSPISDEGFEEKALSYFSVHPSRYISQVSVDCGGCTPPQRAGTP